MKLIFCSILCLACMASLAGAQTADERPSIDLEAAINMALQNNFSYRIAQLDPDIARQAVTIAESAFDPEIFASGQISQSEQNTTFTQTTGTSSDNRSWQAGARKRFAYGTSVTARTNLDRRDSNAGVNTSNLSQAADFSLDLRQPLLRNFGREANLAGIEAATAGYKASIQSLRDRLRSVVAGTERAYWAVSRLQEQLELNKSSLEVAEALLEEAQERERVGLATRVDVLQAQASRAERMEEIIETRRVLGDAIDELFLFMGTFPSEAAVLPDDAPGVHPLDSGNAPVPDFRVAWERAVLVDPGLARQEAEIARQESQRTAAGTDTKPNLDLVLSGAYIGVDEQDAEDAIDNAIDREGHAWAVGLEFSMPWGMRREQAEYRRADKRVDQAELRYTELKQSLYREVRATWRDLQASTQSLEAARLTVSFQEATFEREKSKFEEGVSVFRDVLEAQRDLDQARSRLLRSKFNRLSTEIDLALLTGELLQRHGLEEATFLPE